MRFPAGLAVDYYRVLLAYIRRLHKHTLNYLPEIVLLIEEVRRSKEMLADEFRSDISINPEGLINRIRAYKGEEDYRTYVQKTLERVSARVTEDLSREIEKKIKAGRPGTPGGLRIGISELVGKAVTAEGRALQTLIEQSFIAQNVGLISSIAEQYHDRVANIIWSALREGKSTKELSEELQNAFNITRNRARLIARDQVGKLYGQLNQARQTSVGIKQFIWRTVRDDRVRDEHRALEGKRFSWAEGANGLFPGQDYQCRCYAEPVLEDILAPEEQRPAPPEAPPKEPEKPVQKEPEKPWGSDFPSDEQIDNWKTFEDVQEGMKKIGFDVTFGEDLKSVLAEDPDNWNMLLEQCKTIKTMTQQFGIELNLKGERFGLEFVGGLALGRYYGCYVHYPGKIFLMVNKKILQKAIVQSTTENPWSTSLDIRFLGGSTFTGSREQVLRAHASIARHEYGHWLMARRAKYTDHQAAFNIWKQTKRTVEASFAQKKAGEPVEEVKWFTQICGKKYEEMLAEAWAAYHSPLYVQGMLPKRLEALVARLSKRLRIKP